MEIENLIEALTKLNKEGETLSNDESDMLFEKVLFIIYDMGVSKRKLTQEESRIVAPLIKDVIPELDWFIFVLGLQFNSDSTLKSLICRSGIQFLVDNFDQIPVSEDEMLGDFLIDIKESEYLQDFDEEFVNWKYLGANPWDSWAYTTEELTKPNDVPDTHIWWYNEKLISSVKTRIRNTKYVRHQ